jgi:xylulokinase
MSLMGVDIGTTAVKAAAFDEAGNLLAVADREYPLLFPFPGASELDSRAVMDAACEVIALAAGKVRTTDPVRAIGVASQGEAFTPITADGTMLRNGMTSSDSRSQPLIKPWCDEFGLERLYQITGHTAYPMYTLFKLLWVQREEPEVWDRAAKFLFFEDLLGYVLSGETVTDHTLATRSMLFDLRARRWSAEILARLPLSPDRLPSVVAPGTVIGPIRRALCEKLALAPNAVVVTGGHDQPVGALGAGAAVPGSASYAIGTVECVAPAVGRLILNRDLMDANMATYPHVVPDTYTTVVFNMTGGSVLRWVRDQLAREETAAARRDGADPYDYIVAAADDEPADVILLPHFGPTGTPHFDPQGAGVLFGLTLATTRAQILRAVLEGITYEMKWNLAILARAGIELSELRAIGGGAKSAGWMQIKADVLGVPITTMRVSEATCMGAAILAGSGIGVLEPRAAAASWAVPIRTFDPRPQYHDAYEQRFAIYRDIYRSLPAARSALHALRSR